MSHNRTNFVWFHLFEVPRVVKFIETEVEWWLPGAGRRGEWRISVQRVQSVSTEDEKVLEMVGGDDSTIVNILHATEVYT